MNLKYRSGSALNGLVRKMENGGLFKKKEEEKASTGEGYERGDVYFDKEAGAFFEHRGKLEPRHLKGESGDQATIMRYLKEKGGSAAVGLGSHSELIEQYPDLLSNYSTQGSNPDFPISGGGTSGEGMRSQVKNIMQQALETGDPLLMSAIMNPYNESTASQGIGGIDAYGLDRINKVGTNGGIQFSPAAGDDKGKQYTMGPTLLDKKTLVAEGSGKSEGSESIVDPRTGETILVNPETVNSGINPGGPNLRADGTVLPDQPARTRAQGALPYPQRSGSALRFLARQRSGSRMRLLKQGRRL